jgi:hemerythrin-like domain-containing protein
MDAISILTGDHNRVRGLFTRFKSAEEADDKATMVQLASKIFEELEVHTTIEEEIFYPEIKPTDEEISDTVAEGVEEHGVVKTLMEEMKGVEEGGEEWVAKMKVMMENVEHHADEEEEDMFPPLRSKLADKLEEMAPRMEARKKELGAPTSEDALSLTKEKLTELASAQEIPGRSSMSHEELALSVDPRG